VQPETVAASRGAVVQLTLFASIVVLVAAAVALDVSPEHVVPVLAGVAFLTLIAGRLFTLKGLFILTLLVIMFVPLNRYQLPGSLPINLEPYRLTVAALMLAFASALLVDPDVSLRKSGFGWNIRLVLLAAVASDVVNAHTAASVTSHVIKGFSFLLSYIVVFLIIVSIVKTRGLLEQVIRLLVIAGAIISASAMVERRTQFNIFNHWQQVLPILRYVSTADLTRGGQFRAIASTEHPIELSAVLVCLFPLALYLCRTGSKIWWLTALLILLGNLSTASRTGMVMLLVVALVYALLRPAAVRRFWPLLLPGLVVVHVAVPGAIGSFVALFSPGGGTIASQQGSENIENGRLSHYWRARVVLETDPLFGNGYETRITGTTAQDPNSPVFDNQWLGIIVDTGLLGVFAWVAVFGTVVRKLGRQAKRDMSDRGWLLVALTASLLSFGVGMFFFDAFSFAMVTFIFWILLALGAVTLQLRPWGQELLPEAR
jgi:hypothetical protein